MLSAYVKGRELLANYEEMDPKPKILPKNFAADISRTIMQWAQDSRKKIVADQLEYIAGQIVELFPNEEKVVRFILVFLFNIYL